MRRGGVGGSEGREKGERREEGKERERRTEIITSLFHKWVVQKGESLSVISIIYWEK